MDIEHCDCLSLLLRRRECHVQDGETLSYAATPQSDTASGDPAMAFDLPLNGRAIIRPVFPKSTAVALPGERRTNPVSAANARAHRAQILSGESPAARSTTCNALRRCERGSRAAGAGAIRA